MEINAAIARAVEVGCREVRVKAQDGPWTLSRYATNDQGGSIRISQPNITLRSDGATLIMASNAAFIGVRSVTGTRVTITADTVPTDTTLMVVDSSSFTVGQWAFVRLGQAAYDAAEPDFWLWAKVQAIPDSTHVTLDRPVGYAMSVAAIPSVGQRSIAPIPVLVSDVEIAGTWNLINPLTSGSNAESGVSIAYAHNVKVGTIVGSDCGAAVVGGQFVESMTIDAIKATSAIAQNGHPAKGRVFGVSECRGVRVGLIQAENVERSLIVAEGRCESVEVDKVVFKNTFPGRSIATAVIGVLGNSRIDVRSLHVMGNGSYLSDNGGTSGTDLRITDAYFYTATRPIMNPSMISRRLYVDGILFTDIRTWKRIIPLRPSMQGVAIAMPSGQLRKVKATASSTTGISTLYLGATSTLTNSQSSQLVAGVSVDLTQGAGFGPGYNASADTGKRAVITTDAPCQQALTWRWKRSTGQTRPSQGTPRQLTA